MEHMTISFAGLASGFNSDKYIEAVMKQESIPLTRLQTKIDNTNAYRTAFNNLKTQLTKLKDAAQALADIDAFKSLSATNSNSSVLSATTGTGAVAGDYVITVNKLVSSQVSASEGFSSTADLPDKITINGKAVSIDKSAGDIDAVLAKLAKDINELSDPKVKATIVQTRPGEKSLVLTSIEAGEGGKFTLGSDDPDFWQKNDTGGVALQEASNASFTINGVTVSSATNEIKDVVPGLTLNLTSTGTSTVKVSQDTSGVSDKVDAFVKAYNDIVTAIKNSTKKSEKNSDGTLTLTLQGDPVLRDLQMQLNNWLNGTFGDNENFKLLSQIGLEVDKGVTSASLMTGKISFDKELFQKKLAENPSAVEQMFRGTESSDGVAKLFANNLKSWTDSVDGIVTSKIKGYDAEISYITEQMTSMKERLAKREDSLKKQYVNLEVVMSQLNNQKDWITSQVSMLTKSNSK